VYLISGYETFANFSGQVCVRLLESNTFETFAVKKLAHRMKLRGLDTKPAVVSYVTAVAC
jgi:hypothetical protein